jgi:hypothetical protein
MYILMRRIFTSEEFFFTREEKKIWSCINVHAFTGEESLFTCKDKCICSRINVRVYILVNKLYSHAKINVYAHV